MQDLIALERAVAGLELEELARERWFAGKERQPASATLVDAFELAGAPGAWLALVDVGHVEGTPDRYVVAARIDAVGSLIEPAPADPFWAALAGFVVSGGKVEGRAGTLAADPGALSTARLGSGRSLTDDQSNTSVVLGEQLVLKCYRRVLPGVHPEPELLAALTGRSSGRAPTFGGSLVRHSSAGRETLACLYAFVPGEPVGWEAIIERAAHALAADDDRACEALVNELSGLGRAAAELHVDLVGAFGAELATEQDASRAIETGQARLEDALRVASGDLAAALAPRALQVESALDDLSRLSGSPLTRVHGDLHVGQFIAGPGGPVVVDFEGEPGRPLEMRRRPESPLRDLACLLLSFDHVAVAAARRVSLEATIDRALGWSASARELAATAYREGIEGSPIVFDERLLRALEVEKECHEVIYAATVLPEWSYAPATVLPRLVGRPGEPAA
ncbi:MAG: phosphotransferase [Gaiellaceae bacterium]